MLSLREQYTLYSSNFLITNLCSSSDNCHGAKSKGRLFSEITSELIPVPLFVLEVFYQKNH